MQAQRNDQQYLQTVNTQAGKGCDIEGFGKVEMKEGTTILREKAGLPCCESSAAKKLLPELPSDDGTPLKHGLIIETGTDRNLDQRRLWWCSRNWGRMMSRSFGAQCSLTCLCNQRNKGRRIFSLATRNYSLGRCRSQIIERHTSVQSRRT